MASIFDPWLKKTEMNWWTSRNTNAMAEMASASMTGAMKVGSEAMHFMMERMKQDMALVKQFSACKTGEDVFRTGSSFFDDSVRAYADQTAKMVHVMADATQEACRPFEDRTIEALHSVSLIPKDNGKFA